MSGASELGEQAGSTQEPEERLEQDEVAVQVPRDPEGHPDVEPALEDGHQAASHQEDEPQDQPAATMDEEPGAPTGWGAPPSGRQEAAVASEDAAEPSAGVSSKEEVPVAAEAVAAVAGKPKSWAALVGKAAGQGGWAQPPMQAPPRSNYSAPSVQGRALPVRGGEKPQLSGENWP